LTNIFENIAVAFSAIRMNLVRAMLTIAIIAFGIMALISMITAVEGIKSALYRNFASVGSNTFSVSNVDQISAMKNGMREEEKKPLTYKEADAFENRYSFPATSCISFIASMDAVAQYADLKSPHKIEIIGSDQNYITSAGLTLEGGRNFTSTEVSGGRRVAIIGNSLKQFLYGDIDPIGKHFLLNNDDYMVVGYLISRGSSFGQDQDQLAIVPIASAQNRYAKQKQSYNLSVQVKDINQIDAAIDDATGLLRAIRGLKLNQDNDFFITKSDSLANVVLDDIKVVQIFAFFVGIITLIGAAVGLTNIMLVSVTERTREIGVRKALGATNKNIMAQFLWESVVIAQMGGVFGIIIGLLLGNIVANYFNGTFIIPWGWIISGVIICFTVGIISGLFPAMKASRQDPVESLRYE
jgi:putative ABC transport system permease protein